MTPPSPKPARATFTFFQAASTGFGSRASRHGLVAVVMAFGIMAFSVMAFGGDRIVDAGTPLPRSTELCCSGDIAPVDTIRGTDEANFLTGTSGDDVLIGGGGDDRLRGLAGADLLQGEAGSDVLEGGDGSDILEAGVGNDVLDGGSDKDWLFGDEGDDILRGGDGPDVLDGGPGHDELMGGDGDDTADGGEGDDLLRGGIGDDLLDGSDGSDILFGDDGADDLDGGDESDILMGGGGDDVLSGGDGADQISGGVGNDVLQGGDGADVLRGGPGDDEISGGDGSDVLEGQAGDDLLNGSFGSDQVLGGVGDDILLGSDGTDVLIGGPGQDRLDGGVGEDRLDGGPERDELDGGLDTDQILGGGGDDVIIVVAGDVGARRTEVIEGGAGADTLLLDGFTPGDISEWVELPHLPADSTPGPELSFVMTDPYTGGSYRVSQMEVIRYVTRLPVAEGWDSGTRAVILNTSTSTTAEIEADFLGGDGSSLVTPPGDSVAGWTAYTIPPLGVLEISGDELGITGSAVVQFRANVPLAVTLVGEIPQLGVLGQVNAARLFRSRSALRIDTEAGSTTALALATEGIGRSVQVRLHAEGGGEVDSREVRLEPGGHTVIRLDELFPRVRKFAGSVSVIGGPVFGSTIQTGPGNVGATAYPLTPAAFDRQQEAPLYLPASVTEAGPTVLTLMHRGGGRGPEPPRGVGTVEFLDEDGASVPVQVEGTGVVESVPFALNSFGTTRFPLTPTSEWASIRIQVDSGLVAAVAHQDYGPEGAAQRGPATVGNELVVPIFQAAGSGQETRLAFGSTGEAARIELTLRGRDGQELRGGTATIRLPEGGSSTWTLAELFSGAQTDELVGSLTLSSSAPVALDAVHLDSAARSGFSLPVHRLGREGGG